MQVVHPQQETSHVITQQITERQVSNAVTKMLWEEREYLRKNLEKMDEKEEEQHSPFISVLPKLAGEMSPKPGEQSTQDSTEMNNIEGIDEAMIPCNKGGDKH